MRPSLDGLFIALNTGDNSMPLQINPQTRITLLPPEFVQVINVAVQSSPEAANGSGVIINFRDPSYSAQKGGYHPLEVHIDSKGSLLSITDFAYVGIPPFTELGIELDWSFDQGSFRQYDCMYDLECGRSLLGLYLANFTAYYNSGVYRVEVTTL
jgi:hypothetical protein